MRIATKTNDVSELGRLLHEELLFTDQQGLLITKARKLEAHRSGTLIIDMIRVNEYQIGFLREVAVITSLTYMTGKYKEQLLAGIFRSNRVWTNEGGNWQVIAGSCVELI